MDRKRLIEALTTFCELMHCSRGEFIVLTGAALCLDGVVDECRDIDLAVSPEMCVEYHRKINRARETISFSVFKYFDVDCHNWEEYKDSKTINAYGFRLQSTEDMVNLKISTIDKYYDDFKHAIGGKQKLAATEALKSKLEKLKYAFEYKEKHDIISNVE